MEGIVLRSTPFQESGKIITLFTKECGLVSAIAPRVGKKNVSLNTSLSPLSLSQFHLVEGKTSLYKIRDVSLLSAHLEIRGDLDKLQAAGSILKTLLQTQSEGRPSPDLFALTRSYLLRMESSSNPEILALSFQAKLLRYEGWFPARKEESPVSTISDETWETLLFICLSRSFQDIETLQATTPLRESLVGLLNHTLEML